MQKPLAACQGKTVPGAVLLVAVGRSVLGGPPRPPAGTSLPLPPTRCGPVDGAELECGRIEIDAPESTKNLRLFLES